MEIHFFVPHFFPIFGKKLFGNTFVFQTANCMSFHFANTKKSKKNKNTFLSAKEKVRKIKFTFYSTRIMNGKDKQRKFCRKNHLGFLSFLSRNHQSNMHSISFTKLTCSSSLFVETPFFEKSQSALFFSKKEKTEKSTKYILQKYQRSNQDTLIFQRPLVREGEWIQSGDILADCSTSLGGELSLGKNIFIAYMPWEGYNYEDAILISQRLVTEDVYTSIHIESYEVETRSTKIGKEQITKKIPEVPESQLCHLDDRGIVKRGTSVKEGDILVGKVTPVQKKFISAYEKLLYTILEKELIPMRDSSLRTPKGLKAKVLEVKILNFSTEKIAISKKKKFSTVFQNSYSRQDTRFADVQADQNIFRNPFFNQKNVFFTRNVDKNTDLEQTSDFSIKEEQKQISFSVENYRQNLGAGKKNFSFFVPSFSTNTKILKRKRHLFSFFLQNRQKTENQNTFQQTLFQKADKFIDQKNPPFQKSNSFWNGKNPFFASAHESGGILSHQKRKNTKNQFSRSVDEKNFQKPEKVQVYLVEKRKIQVGDKMSGRHGNKGIVSQILPIPDMPFLPDGTPLDMVLNPLGVPSRMNVGQIYECILGLASKYLQQYYRIIPFDEIYGPQASRSFTFSKLYEAREKTSQKWLFNPCYPGKMQIFDGRTGEPYENPVTVGISYILKLVHLVDDKIHARSTGPYSLVTQQPLKGRSKYGGQRLGEMEVWAIEAYGAAFVLLEMLTIKSDDISGRMTLWSNILLNMPIYIGTPESFKVLVCELQALCLDMGLYRLNKKGFLTQVEHLMQLP